MLSFTLPFALAVAVFTSGTAAAPMLRRGNDTSVQQYTGISSNSLPYYTETRSGIATYFDGAPSALACGDIRNSTETQKFAALCHTLFDSAPGSSATTLLNPNKSPVCGSYVDGRMDISGAWTSASQNTSSYVMVGGDGAFSCVGTPGVACHKPRTLTVSYGGQNVTGVEVVDRMGREACNSGDLDISQLVFTNLVGSLTQGIIHDITWTFEA